MVRILLIDDAPSFRLLLKHLLTEDGDIELVGEAGDVEEGLALAAELRPDVVVTDNHLGARTGIEAAEELRAAAPGARIVVLSGRSREDLLDEARAAGVDALMEKSADPADLREVIREQAARTD